MDLSRYLEIEHLLRHKWSVAIIICLGGGPLRHVELGMVLSAKWASTRIADGSINRSLRQLTEERVVEQVADEATGNLVWKLTDEGQQRLAKLITLGAALDDDDTKAQEALSDDTDAGNTSLTSTAE